MHCDSVAEPRKRAALRSSVRTPAKPVEQAASLTYSELPVELVDELGGILGEALVQQYQRDTAAMGNTRSGIRQSAEGEGGGLMASGETGATAATCNPVSAPIDTRDRYRT